MKIDWTTVLTILIALIAFKLIDTLLLGKVVAMLPSFEEDNYEEN